MCLSFIWRESLAVRHRSGLFVERIPLNNWCWKTPWCLGGGLGLAGLCGDLMSLLSAEGASKMATSSSRSTGVR